MILCSECKGNQSVPIHLDGKRVGIRVCFWCNGSGEEPLDLSSYHKRERAEREPGWPHD